MATARPWGRPPVAWQSRFRGGMLDPVHPRPARLAALVACLCCAAAHDGVGAETSPYYIGLSLSRGHESNVLQLADGVEPAPGFERADDVTATTLLAGFDQRISRQRIYGSLSLRSYRYANNGALDNLGYSASAGIDWATVGRVSGSLRVNGERSLSLYDEQLGVLAGKNLVTSRAVTGGVSVGVVTQYSLELTGGHRDVGYSLDNPVVRSREFRQDNGALGLRWRPSGVGSVTLSLSTTRGVYPKFSTTAGGEDLADRFKRTSVDLGLSMQPTGASSLDARISHGRTRFDLNQERDFSGTTGIVSWSWQATGKLKTNLFLTRETGQDSYAVLQFNVLPATLDYSRVISAVGMKVEHDLTAKLALTASYGIYRRSLVATTLGAIAQAPRAGRDSTANLALGARWAPWRSTLLGCNAASSRRQASGELTAPGRSTSFSCYVQATLQ